MAYRRRYKRRYRPRARRVPLGAFPRIITKKLRYVQTSVINPPIAGTGDAVFRANSLFDPDRTGTGHQPYGFDQLAVAYGHYIVTGSRITARYLPVTASGDATPVVLAIVGSISPTSLNADMVSYMERRTFSSYKIIGSFEQGLAAPAAQVRSHYSLRKIFGNESQDLSANMTGNPVEEYFYHVLVGKPGTGTDEVAMTFLVTIDYVCRMFESDSSYAQS